MEIDRRSFLRIGAGAAAMVVGACTGRQHQGPLSTPPPSANPALPVPPVARVRLPGGDIGLPQPFSGPATFARALLIYDTLLVLRPTSGKQELLPWLASGFQRAPDGLTYTFELRDNVRWHDGRPLTADDVVFTFRYYAEQGPKLPPGVVIRPHDVAEVAATGPRTVQFRLDRPIVTFARSVAGQIPIIPRHVWSSITDAGAVVDPSLLVGSGPYRLESYNRAQETYDFVANDTFFLGRPFVRRVEYRPVDDPLVAMRKGAIDAGAVATTGAGTEVVLTFSRDPALGMVEGNLEFPSVLYWNLSRGGVLSDVRFRRACALAIDRTDLVERLLGGRGAPGNPGFLPPDHPYHVDVEQYPHDPGAANRLLDQAGYRRSGRRGVRLGPDGKPLSFQVLALAPLSDLFHILETWLEEIGVHVEPDPVDFPSALRTMAQGRYDMALIFYGNVSADPDYMRVVGSSRAPDRGFMAPTGYSDAEFDELADRQLVTIDEVQRQRLIARMQRILARDIPFLHLYYTRSVSFYRKSVFDQWPAGGDNKVALVTGLREGGLEIRATKAVPSDRVDGRHAPTGTRAGRKA